MDNNNKPNDIIWLWMLTFCILGFSVALIILGYRFRLEKVRNDILTKDKIQLEADRDNEIYALNLELKGTEKTLAETAYELERLVLEQSADDNISFEYLGEYKCTAYCCEKYSHICGSGNGKTASGAPLTADISVAVTDLNKMPYGTVIYIEDVGIRIVQDTGSFPKNQIDVAVDTHKHASNWEGQGKHKVYILQIKDAD